MTFTLNKNNFLEQFTELQKIIQSEFEKNDKIVINFEKEITNKHNIYNKNDEYNGPEHMNPKYIQAIKELKNGESVEAFSFLENLIREKNA